VIELARDGAVHVLRMTAGENRIGPDFLAAFARALDEVEASSDAAALVTTGAGRFYSNGLDLAALADLGARAWEVVAGLQALLARILAFPAITVAALNGHAFAGGALLAFAHDFRVMRADRGWLCLPEVDLATGKPMTPAMFALLTARLETPVVHELLATGRRLAAPDAWKLRAVDAVADAEDLVARAVALAGAHAGKDRATVAALKRGRLAAALGALARADQP
jgi:enoyl-CoA hydratase/carnithine racemase